MDWNKASGLSGIGNFILGVAVVCLMLWQIFSPQSAQAPSATQGASHMMTWILPSVLGLCIVLAAVLHFVAASRTVRKPSATGKVSGTDDKKLQGRITEVEDEKATLECPDEWLHELAERDRHEIGEVVAVVDCRIYEQRFDLDSPYITFEFIIFNGSIYPVTIERAVSGFITYSQRRLEKEITPKGEWKAKNIQRGQAVRIWITQWLNKDDVNFIKEIDPNYACFYFEQLTINVTCGDDSDNTKPQPVNFGLVKAVDIRTWR
jgi:hypothetical protein